MNLINFYPHESHTLVEKENKQVKWKCGRMEGDYRLLK
jgi:hypothetical protein